jgi:muramoyltetrapeptide carboxypeptidase
LIKPKELEFGDTLGLVAPASFTSKEKIEKSIETVEKMGFKVKLGESIYQRYGYLSGKDEIRAKDINEMFKDPEVDGIICLRGGYGTPRILDLIDYNIIKDNPKVFIGYSDITALHIAFNQICKLVTFHGPMVSSDIIGNFHEFSKESLYKSIMNNREIGLIENPPGEEIIKINTGVVEGTIIGGNLSLIADTIGTQYEIDTKRKILFIEEVGEEPYSIDRMLNQLRLSGKLKDAAGIILGDFRDCEPKGHYEDSLNLEELIEDYIKPLNKPSIYNLQSGHCDPIITLPLGINTRLDGDSGEVYILENAVK